jgi:hypothetical protein
VHEFAAMQQHTANVIQFRSSPATRHNCNVAQQIYDTPQQQRGATAVTPTGKKKRII